MMNRSHIAVLILGIGLCSACRTVYSPNAANSPLLQEEKEFKALVAPNNVQAAYAVTDHFGVMLNGYLNSYTSDDKDFHNKGKALELGIGYFNKTPGDVIYEVWGGAGRFNVAMDEASASKRFDAKATKLFIQPGVGWVSPYFDLGLSSRFSMLNYNSPEITGYTQQEQRDYYFESLAVKPHLFWEPAITVRGGYKWIKLQVQYGRVIKLSTNQLNYSDDFTTIGVSFNLAQWYK
jgi:hypothetical protein